MKLTINQNKALSDLEITINCPAILLIQLPVPGSCMK